MSASICTTCLSRLRISAAITPKFTAAKTIVPIISSFHTSAVHQNVVAKKKSGTAPTAKFREARSAKPKKKQRERPKPPPVGERKTQRKRIVLSNTNALEVPGLEYLSEGNMADQNKLGHMLALEGVLLDQLRDSRAFKTTQNWNMFRQPSTLMREESIELGQDIADINASREDQGMGPRTVHKIIHGERASGKSIHLLQAMSMGFLNDWVVVSIPEAQDFVINQSAYSPIPQAEGEADSEQLYAQPKLASEILSRVATSNANVLSQLKLIHDHGDLPIKKHSTLQKLAQYGAEEASVAPAVFSALWKELTLPPTDPKRAQPRPSLMITIDGLNHWMGPTKYRNANYKILHAHQFTLIRHFLSILFSSKSNPLPNGGMILGATSGSNSPDYPTFTILLSQLNALHNQDLQMTDPNFPMPTPYAKADRYVLNLLKDASNTGITNLSGLSKGESKGLLEYFARSGMLRETVTDGFIGQQWSLSGGGVVGELCKAGKRLRV